VLSTRILAVAFLFAAAGSATQQPAPGTLRWVEGEANCTLHSSNDGHTYYGLSTGDFEITLGVDHQELEKIPHRTIPMMGVFLSFHYKGPGRLQIMPYKYALEFVKHRHLVQNWISPQTMLERIKADADDLTDEVEHHQIRKHPEQREQKEAELNLRLKDFAEMKDFVNLRALNPFTLNANNRFVSGWVFFSTENKWIGAWHRPEQFVLRMPVKDSIVEFPFELPPKRGAFELRRRPGGN
jgi:hypothetical protein